MGKNVGAALVASATSTYEVISSQSRSPKSFLNTLGFASVTRYEGIQSKLLLSPISFDPKTSFNAALSARSENLPKNAVCLAKSYHLSQKYLRLSGKISGPFSV